MLYWLAKQLTPHISAFNAFSYLTLRVILAVMSSLALALLVGPAMIANLSRYQIGQVVRDDGPQTHLKKAGTPTMGGLLILVAIFVGTLLWADLSNRLVWIVLGVTLSFGLIGFWDDYLKLVKKNPNGLIARRKYLWQSIAGLGAALALWFTAHSPADVTLYLPFFKSFAQPLNMFGFVALAYLMIVGMSNAVNLTDGLDGLAIMPAVMVAGALGVFCWSSGNVLFAQYLLETLAAFMVVRINRLRQNEALERRLDINSRTLGIQQRFVVHIEIVSEQRQHEATLALK